MAQFRKTPLLEGIRDTLRGDSAHTTFAMSSAINITRQDPDPDAPEWAHKRGNEILVRDGGGSKIESSTCADIWEVLVNIAYIARNARADKHFAMKEVNDIEDDGRGLLDNNTAVYSETGVSVQMAEVVDVPPTETVWGGLYEGLTREPGYDMAVLTIKYTIYQRRDV